MNAEAGWIGAMHWPALVLFFLQTQETGVSLSRAHNYDNLADPAALVPVIGR